jgi:diaminopimelate decarboxylase
LAARRGVKAGFAIRVNPDVDASTHPYISTGLREHKFGIDIADAEAVYERTRKLPNLAAEGVSCHIGSQLMDTNPILEAIDRVLALIERLRAKGFELGQIDLGGGLGVAYQAHERAPEIRGFIAQVRAKLQGRGVRLTMEPGRSIVGRAGVLLTRVLYRKNNAGKEFVIVDAAMNDLIRPALYQAHHEIVPVRRRAGRPRTVDVVGPVCETGDFFARDRKLAPVEPGDLVALLDAGAYGMAQSSNYNTRPRAAEVLVEGAQARLIRRRETMADLLAPEIP